MLPNLIFCDDNHNNIFTRALMSRLIPLLKEMGYTAFYDEAPEDYVPIDCYENLGEREAEVKKVIVYFKKYLELKLKVFEEMENGSRYEIDRAEAELRAFEVASYDIIASKEDLYALMKLQAFIQQFKHSAPASDQVSFAKMAYTNCYTTLIERNEAKLLLIVANSQLFEDIMYHELNYRGVDDEAGRKLFQRCVERATSSDDVHDMPEYAESMRKRDGAMAGAYLAAQETAFGKIGIAHANGMQQIMQKNTNHCFVYVYNDDAMLDAKVSKDCKLSDIRQHPRGLVLVDARNIDMDEAVKQVIDIVRQKSELEKNANEQYVCSRQTKLG